MSSLDSRLTNRNYKSQFPKFVRGKIQRRDYEERDLSDRRIMIAVYEFFERQPSFGFVNKPLTYEEVIKYLDRVKKQVGNREMLQLSDNNLALLIDGKLEPQEAYDKVLEATKR